MKKKALIFFTSLPPLFAGLLVIQAKPAPVDLHEYLVRYALFVALFIFWSLVRTTVPQLFLTKAKSKSATLWRFLIFILCALFLLCILYIQRYHFSHLEYEMLLALIGLSALALRFFWIKRFYTWLILEILYFTGLGFMSFQIVDWAWEWQPFLFCFTIACSTVLVHIAADEGGELYQHLKKSIKFLIVLTPISIGILVMNRDLGPLHGIVFLMFIAAYKFDLLNDQDLSQNKLVLKTFSLWFGFLAVLTSIAFIGQ